MDACNITIEVNNFERKGKYFIFNPSGVTHTQGLHYTKIPANKKETSSKQNLLILTPKIRSKENWSLEYIDQSQGSTVDKEKTMLGLSVVTFFSWFKNSWGLVQQTTLNCINSSRSSEEPKDNPEMYQAVKASRLDTCTPHRGIWLGAYFQDPSIWCLPQSVILDGLPRSNFEGHHLHDLPSFTSTEAPACSRKVYRNQTPSEMNSLNIRKQRTEVKAFFQHVPLPNEPCTGGGETAAAFPPVMICQNTSKVSRAITVLMITSLSFFLLLPVKKLVTTRHGGACL